MNTLRFKPGQTVICREFWQNKVWSERPEIVVRDSSELLALYLPPNTIIRQPVSLTGSKANYIDRLNFSWALTKAPWNGMRRLRLTIPGAFYSVMPFWNEDDSLRAWYINLEESLHWTPQGFEYIDLFLDILVEPDLSGWRWLDEDELREAVERDFISTKTSDMLYSEGRYAIEWLQSGNSPFNGWETWRPDPSWQLPVLREE